MTQSRYVSRARSDTRTGRSLPTWSSSSFCTRACTCRRQGIHASHHKLQSAIKFPSKTGAEHFPQLWLASAAGYLWVVQKVGQDPQQCGRCRLNSSPKSFSCCHEHVIIRYRLLFQPPGLVSPPAAPLANQEGIQEVTGLIVSKRGLRTNRTVFGSNVKRPWRPCSQIASNKVK